MKKIFLLLVFFSTQISALAVNSGGSNALGICPKGYTLQRGATCDKSGCQQVAAGCCHTPGHTIDHPTTPVISDQNVNLGICPKNWTLERGGTCEKHSGCQLVASGCCHKPGEKVNSIYPTPGNILTRVDSANPENENFCTVILALKKYKLTGALEDIYADLISECTK